MADTVSKSRRSEMMSRIRSKRTKPEMAIHGHLKARKMPHSMWPNWIEGPDIVVEAAVAVFVHGCFWHGCPEHYREPKSNVEFWRRKVRRNKARDERQVRRLRRDGWTVVMVWEHDLRTAAGTRRAADRIERAAKRRRNK